MKKLAAFILLAYATSAFAATAIWTGQQRQITTVTYQIAWNCEYNVNGQKFWRVFKDSCPGSIEVQ